MICPTCGAAVEGDVPKTLSSTPHLNNRWLVPMVTGILIVLPLVALLSTAVVLWSQGTRELLTSTSPDGKFRVSVVRHLDFPALDFIHAPVTLQLALIEVETGKLLDDISIGIEEESDTGTPVAEWPEPGIAKITKLHRHNELTTDLNARRWTQP